MVYTALIFSHNINAHQISTVNALNTYILLVNCISFMLRRGLRSSQEKVSQQYS